MTRKRADIAQHGRFLRVGPISYADVAEGQKAHAWDMAGSIERGESFSVLDAAAMVRARAEQPWSRTAGRPPAGAAAAELQKRQDLRQAAAAIDAGEPFDVPLVAAALRAWADALSVEPKRRPGNPPKHDHAVIALEFEAQRRRRPDVSDNTIMGEIAEKYGVDDSTIKEARIACGGAARRHFDAILGRAK